MREKLKISAVFTALFFVVLTMIGKDSEVNTHSDSLARSIYNKLLSQCEIREEEGEPKSLEDFLNSYDPTDSIYNLVKGHEVIFFSWGEMNNSWSLVAREATGALLISGNRKGAVPIFKVSFSDKINHIICWGLSL